jgi:hypothetical protein
MCIMQVNTKSRNNGDRPIGPFNENNSLDVIPRKVNCFSFTCICSGQSDFPERHNSPAIQARCRGHQRLLYAQPSQTARRTSSEPPAGVFCDIEKKRNNIWIFLLQIKGENTILLKRTTWNKNTNSKSPLPMSSAQKD